MKRVKKNKTGQSKQDWIATKTAFLIQKEGYKADQAYAIANSIYNKEHHQMGGFQAGNTNVAPNIGFTQTTPTFQPTAPNQFGNFAQNLAQNNPLPISNNNGFTYDPNIVNPSNLPSGSIASTPQDPYSLAADVGSGQQVNNQNEKFQFFNPYGGGDAYSGAYGLGESIQQGDTLGIIGSGLQTSLHLLRTGFAGAANARRGDYVMQDAMEKYREGLKPAPQSMQQGGTFANNMNMVGRSNVAQLQQTLEQQKINEQLAKNLSNVGTSNMPQFRQKTNEQIFLDDLAKTGDYNEQQFEALMSRPVNNRVNFLNPVGVTYGTPEEQLQRQQHSAYQQGGMFNYNRAGDQPITRKDLSQINQAANIQFTPEFAQSYFSTQSAPPIQQTPTVDYSRFPIMDITAEGQFGDRKVWNVRPENLIGQEPQEGKDYRRIPYKQWQAYQQSPEYLTYRNKGIDGRMADDYEDGGVKDYYQDGGQTPAQDPQQIMQQVAEAIQGGADPNKIIEQLIQSGVPHADAMGMVEAVMQQMQGGEQQAEIPQEQTESFEAGGIKKKSLPKLLTGEYTAEKDNISEDEVVAEVEKNEYIKQPDGNITQAIGNSHENGGIELTEEQLPENSKILSDHLKAGAELAKTYKDLGVSAKDTYATVLEKWTKKSGLKKLVEEQEDLIKQLEVQTKLLVDRPNSKDAIQLNTNLLQGKIAEIEAQKEPLDKERETVFEVLFSAQEASKPKEETTEVMQQGGTFNGDIIVEYAKKHGITPERANELVKEYQKGGVAKYANGGNVGEERLNDFFLQSERLGYKGKKNIGDIQKWMNANHPDAVVKYFTEDGQPLTAKHVDIIKNKYKDVFSKTGIPATKKSEDYTPEEKLTLQNALGEKATKDFYLEGFADNKWDWRAPMIPMTLTPAGVVTTPNQLPTAVSPFLNTPTPSVAVEPEKKGKFENLDNAQRVKTGIMNLPNQYAQLPDALQGALKLEYRPNLVENQNITADPIITEIRRGEQSAMQSIQNLPDEQRAAAVAQIQANTQEQINKVMQQVQGQNLQSNTAVAGQNAQTLNQAQDINNRYLSDYENKIYKAQAITDADRRNYFAHNQKVNLANYNAINNANLLNQLTENYQITPEGIQFVNNPTFQQSGLSEAQMRQNILNQASRIKAEDKKAIKKNGGRFKKGN